MSRRASDDPLFQGLNYHERLRQLETTVYGHRVAAGLVERVEDLQSDARQRAMPWYVRWFVLGRRRRSL